MHRPAGYMGQGCVGSKGESGKAGMHEIFVGQTCACLLFPAPEALAVLAKGLKGHVVAQHGPTPPDKQSMVHNATDRGTGVLCVQDLHAHIETLTARLMAATSERDKAENSLALQARQHQVGCVVLCSGYAVICSNAVIKLCNHASPLGIISVDRRGQEHVACQRTYALLVPGKHPHAPLCLQLLAASAQRSHSVTGLHVTPALPTFHWQYQPSAFLSVRCGSLAEEQRLRDKHEAQLQQQQQQHRAHAEAQERDLIELKLKIERLQEQGAKVRYGNYKGRETQRERTGKKGHQVELHASRKGSLIKELAGA
eukprot:1160185-Pelagomonas_calceolata.AAC.13